jgi:hypothetical protein
MKLTSAWPASTGAVNNVWRWYRRDS